MAPSGFNGQHGRQFARPAADHGQGAPAQQPTWPNSQGHQSAGQENPAQPAWLHSGAGQGHSQHGYPQQGYPQGYGYQPANAGGAGYGGQGVAGDPYVPNFQPFEPAAASGGAPSRGGHAVPQQQYAPEPSFGQRPHYGTPEDSQQVHGYGGAEGAQHWGQPQPHDPASYLRQPGVPAQPDYLQSEAYAQGREPNFSDWQHQNGAYAGQAPQGYDYGDVGSYGGQHAGHDPYGDAGFAHAQGGELDQAYADEDGEEYEYEEPSSARRPMMIVAALAGAVLVGGGMAYGYKALFGGGPSGTPPVVKSAELPEKTKPADAGGKKFAHTDSKIMGRLGEGSGASSSSDLDGNGTRKVATLVVGRDGSIQAPPSEPAPTASDANPTVSVPGMMVVDALGPRGGQSASDTAAASDKKVVVRPPPEPERSAEVTTAEVLNRSKPASQTGSIEGDDTPEPPVKTQAKPTAKQVAALEPKAANDAARAAPVTSNGFVAVLSSVPKSSSSRMDALKRFADLQQKYGDVLNGKTPDVAEANLGAKGTYHRLIVGPPGSRQQASSVCSELKTKGYSGCWVTTY